MSKPVTATKPNVARTKKYQPVRPPLSVVHKTILATNDLHKSYRKGKLEVPVLKGVDIEIAEGGFTTIIGQSGSGKSTLLHLLATLDAPDRGEIVYGDTRIDNLPSKKREAIRNQEFGLIFQFYHLLPELTTLENVLIPRMVQDGFFRYLANKKKYKQEAKELLDMVGLGHRLTHKPSELSGGEMQRTAIARSLISNPKVLLADEPTGNLDEENGGEVMKTLHELRSRKNLTIVMVTHDAEMAKSSDHVIHLVGGKVQQ
ncbi:ABC transporter ATP-binding protein [Mariniblastus fucicola]|uniref:P-loop containing nucleoside triphosphate hydrolase n=1 Tax=Mariniblastus fucicola TaxID=980251 RepID=A0A5B9P9S3_9BACT|nr:ABC transporter ATP-binding protein [Mariniblastus fucicola]QEG23078.1 P-loop containing nucleoside triphosphate hydrolase [Mariniblastus fucicola]